MPSPAPVAQLGPLKFQHIDTGLTKIPVGGGVPVRSYDQSRTECKDIIPVVPLLTGCLIAVATGRNDIQPPDIETRIVQALPRRDRPTVFYSAMRRSHGAR